MTEKNDRWSVSVMAMQTLEKVKILIRRSAHRMSTISVKLTVHPGCHHGTPGPDSAVRR